MIEGTAANCKIKSITVSDLTASVTCVLYSTSPAKIQRGFKFYLRDKDATLTAISENVYWIDRLNNYNNDSLNIDVNQYHEVLLEIDISNKNKSEIIDNKWVRHCNLVLKNINDFTSNIAWISEDLTLVSKEFEIPTIKNLNLYSDEDYKLNIDFKYKYKSQQDFNYNNTNLYTSIDIISIHTHKVLENILISNEDYSSKIKTTSINSYNVPIKVHIQLKNNKDVTLYSIEKIYKPIIKRASTYIKTKDGVFKVLAFYTKEHKYINEATIVDTIKVNFDSVNIKVNADKVTALYPSIRKPSINATENSLTITNHNDYLQQSWMVVSYKDKVLFSTDNKTYDFLLPDDIKEDIKLNNNTLELSVKVQGSLSLLYKEETFDYSILIISGLCSDNTICSNTQLIRDYKGG